MRLSSILLLFSLVPAFAVNNTHTTPPLAGFSVSVYNASKGCNFELYQIHGIYSFFNLYGSPPVIVPIGFEVAFGLLKESSLSALLVHGNLQIGASVLDDKIAFVCGSGPAMISRFEFPNRDLGSYHHFISFIGLRFAPAWRLGAGVRFQHMSNGDLNSQNPGLNMVVAEINYLFVSGKN